MEMGLGGRLSRRAVSDPLETTADRGGVAWDPSCRIDDDDETLPSAVTCETRNEGRQANEERM